MAYQVLSHSGSVPPSSCDDVDAFLCALARIAASDPDSLAGEEKAAAGLFDFSEPFYCSRAPGRLDVMGGIADYSGSLVLQMPIAEAACVALQLRPERTSVRVVSFGAAAGGRAPLFEIELAELRTAGGAPTPLAAMRARLGADPSTSWAAYVVGVLSVLLHEVAGAAFGGMDIVVSSRVPEGKGVSSSAAVEVATMMAVLGASGLSVGSDEAVALLCQKVENLVVGAPCGVMDQMASALGRSGGLLALLCQPAEVRPPVPIPPHVRLWGIDSGVRHSVGGSDYGSVRTAAFMGRAILRATAPERCAALEHLVHLSPSELSALPPLPEALTGAAFAAAHGSHGDAVTTVDPAREYAVARCAAHPVDEHFRVGAFELALRAPPTAAQLPLLGELMFQSHASYSAIGLGSEGTDLLVRLVRAEGGANGLHGAKITGGGSGGTVCVLGEAGAAAEAAFARVLQRYRETSGHEPYVVEGSSAGALQFGHAVVRLKAL